MFQYKNIDSPSGIWPRHPLVSFMGLFGILLAVVTMTFATTFAAKAYLMIVLGLYLISTMHHWMKHAQWRRKLDHIMIYMIIGATVFPYWELHIQDGKLPVIILLWSVITFGIVIKMFGLDMHSRKISGALFGFAGILSVATMWGIQNHVGLLRGGLFWLGVTLLGFQLLIYSKRWFNYRPQYFGYREVQHLALLVGLTLHSVLAMQMP